MLLKSCYPTAYIQSLRTCSVFSVTGIKTFPIPSPKYRKFITVVQHLKLSSPLEYQIMRSKRLENTRNHCNKVAEEVSHEVKSRRGLMTGDVVWVRIRGSLWWPAQVVDENMVSRSSKPKTKVLDQVLVRLYGTYAYLYRDPVNDRAELNKILKENNGSYLETFKKALEQDLSHRKPSKLKRSGCEPTENGGVETPKDKKSKHEANIVNDQKLNCPSSVTPLKGSPELNARRIRVMQGLGLVAPRGSPFQKK